MGLEPGIETMHKWLQALGYNEAMYQERSRAFSISFHSSEPLSVQMRDALLTDLDFRTS